MTVNITKNFKSFKEGLSELIHYVPDVKKYIGIDEIESNVDQVELYNTVCLSLLNAVKNDIPTIWNYKYPGTLGLTIKGKEVSFKTSEIISFSWRIDNVDVPVFSFRISLYLRKNTQVPQFIDNMMLNGWYKLEQKVYTGNNTNKLESNTEE